MLWLQRVAMIEGVASLTGEYCHQPFYTLTIGLYGWLDLVFQRDAAFEGPPLVRDPKYFFAAEAGMEPPIMLQEEKNPHRRKWHLTWSPPAIRFWQRLRTRFEKRRDPLWVALRWFVAVTQDWYGPIILKRASIMNMR